MTTEVSANWSAFQALVPGLMVGRAGYYAVMRDRKMVKLFQTFAEACEFCDAEFPDGRYLIAEVMEEPVWL